VCDTLCVCVHDGMLFAKNSDRHPDEAQVVEWHPPRIAGSELRTQYLTITDAPAYGFVGSRPTWLRGVEHGVNEHGVAIGNEKIWTVDRPRSDPPGLLGMDLVRLGLERAATADEAVAIVTELLEQHGQGGSGEPHADEPYFSSFLVADAARGWVIETSDREWVARPAGAGTAISNRVSMSTDWTRASAGIAPGTDFDSYRLPAMPTSIADHRLTATRACVAAGATATPAAVASTLRDHGPRGRAGGPPPDIGDDGSGFSVCMHRADMHAQTTASLIAHLPPGMPPRLWVALGNPCVSVYVPAAMAAVAPELGDAATWTRFARLRDQVEAGTLELAAVRAALDPIEAELWDHDDPSFAPVAEALHRLGV
jgi:secernin